MLAAVLLRSDRVWFLKLVGAIKPVTEQVEHFRAFVESIRFVDEGATPEWKLPEGWLQKAGNGMRHATVEINSSTGPLELTVTPLKATPGDFEDYVLANVDRWRQQLGLMPTSKAALFGPGERSGELVELKGVDGEKTLLVDLTGESGSSAASGLAGSSPHPGLGPPPTGPAGQGPAARQSLTYETPSGWSEGKVDGLRQVAFDVSDGVSKAEITVIALTASSGDLLANVNRWRDQIHLAPITRDELERQVKEFTVDGVKGHRVDLVGPPDAQPREAVFGVICTSRDIDWFFKMKGNAELVQREQARFESFVHSVKFGGTDGAGDGQ